jgi:hypothetical protein
VRKTPLFGRERQSHSLVKGKCSISDADDGKFIEIEQQGNRFHCLFDQSNNRKFIAAWQMSVNPLEDKNKEVCLIENRSHVIWSEKFELVETCRTSDNGTVIALIHSMVPTQTANNLLGVFARNSIVIVPRGQSKHELEFSTREEVMALALSRNGDHLVYNLQQYRPEDYSIVLYNIHDGREEWRYKYPRKQVIHELIFTDDRILVYAGPRPSAYVDRRYSFTLDLMGRLLPDDPEESRKQEERDSIAKTKKDYSSQASSILRASLAGIVPTIETEDANSKGWEEIMNGNRSLPAFHITLRPVPEQSSAELARAKMGEKGYRFLLHVHVIAGTEQERNMVSRDCIQILRQQKDSLEKKGLAFETNLHSRNIGFYPGSGSYFRADISCVVTFPTEQRPRLDESQTRSFSLQSGESIVYESEAFLKSPLGNLPGKIILTNERLVILIKQFTSEQLRMIASMPPKKAQNIVLGDDGEKYIVPKDSAENARVYFKQGKNGDFEAFKKQFDLFRKR